MESRNGQWSQVLFSEYEGPMTKRRAQEQLSQRGPDLDVAQTEAALRRALARLEFVQKRRRKPGRNL